MTNKNDFHFALPKLKMGLFDQKPTLDVTVKTSTWYDPNGNISAYGWVNEACYILELRGIAFYTFASNAQEVTAIPFSNVSDTLVSDHFYRTVLPLFFQVSGFEALHASAVSTPFGIIGFCAISGTGKSTLAYALSKHSYKLWADDALIWKIVNGSPYTYKIPSDVLLHEHTFEFFQNNVEIFNSTQKTQLQNNKCTLLKSVFFLNRVPNNENTCEIKRLSPGEAFSNLLTHAYVFELEDTSKKRLLINNYLDLAKKIPAYSLSFTSDLKKIPIIIESIEKTITE